MASQIDKIKPNDERVESRFIDVGGNRWRMLRFLQFVTDLLKYLKQC